ncbi:uncharacterized protein LOC107626900 [Arachis ipaensis]|uniref:uncharacterized protein LOC107626900 n=1 Tax=Arachis ipaensis TaxID=130454 RepID=UPI0007AFDC82|nr:uncharacterized protein LOC107626900 [Arachis ipaensis]
MDRLRKEMSCIVQGETEPLYEYWERFRKLLDACPNHMLDTQVLLGYICQGMREQDRTLLDTSSNGSLSKYKTAEEAWQLIIDLAESNQHMKRRVNRPRTVNEVSTSSEATALTQSLNEMTSVLRQLQLNQQQLQQPQSYQQHPPPPQQHNQQLVPQRVCGICSCYSHHTDECPSLQEDNTLAAVSFSLEEAMKHPPENHSLFRCDPIDNIVAEVHLARLDEKCMVKEANEESSEPNTTHHTNHPETQTSKNDKKMELKPLPPHLRFGDISKKDEIPHQNMLFCEIFDHEEERIDIEEVVEEETPQAIVEDEAQPTKETTKAKRTLEEEIAQPIPFPTLAKKAKKRIELDPKMVEMFKKVELDFNDNSPSLLTSFAIVLKWLYGGGV